MKYLEQKANERKSWRSFLEKKVRTLELVDSSKELLKECHTYKDELELVYYYITEAIVLRSKADCYEHGKKAVRPR